MNLELYLFTMEFAWLGLFACVINNHVTSQRFSGLTSVQLYVEVILLINMGVKAADQLSIVNWEII